MKFQIVLTAAGLIISSVAMAQRPNKVFAITSDNKENPQGLWMNISEVDMNTGQIIRPLFESKRTSFAMYDGVTKSKLLTEQIDILPRSSNDPSTAAVTMIAAAAYDQRHNRLFYAPLLAPELRWIDLDDKNTTLKVYTIPLSFISRADLLNEANHITRMTMGADGYGYALTNDANHLIRFSSGRQLAITDLGALQDAASNGTISVHNRCSSYGGDIIGDADGNLYLISAYHAIFKIDVPSKTCTYLGMIKNLPPNYTTNGAAIDENGYLIVCSANSMEGFFKVDMTGWEAVKVPGTGKVASMSDLASAHFAFEKKKAVPPATNVFSTAIGQLRKVTVYPNPVVEGLIRVSFDNKEKGRYQLQLVDLAGRVAFQQLLTVADKYQLVEVNVPYNLSKGIYIVKVFKTNARDIYTDRILIE